MWWIQDVINDTVVPSWINSVPYNYGKAAASILKADEWQNMTTIYFPLALISMWGEGSIHQTALDAIKLCEILDHTMLLVLAISLVCMHTMTETRSKAYLDCMIQYILCSQNFIPMQISNLIIICQCMYHNSCDFTGLWSRGGVFHMSGSSAKYSAC